MDNIKIDFSGLGLEGPRFDSCEDLLDGTLGERSKRPVEVEVCPHKSVTVSFSPGSFPGRRHRSHPTRCEILDRGNVFDFHDVRAVVEDVQNALPPFE